MIWPLNSFLALSFSQFLAYYALDTGLLTFTETYQGCFYIMAFALLVLFAWNVSSITGLCSYVISSERISSKSLAKIGTLSIILYHFLPCFIFLHSIYNYVTFTYIDICPLIYQLFSSLKYKLYQSRSFCLFCSLLNFQCP